jgi:hypothetical protein
MKKTTAFCLSISLALACTGTAQADWGQHRGYRNPPATKHHHRHHDRHGQNWVGPAAILAITGLAIGAAYSQAQAAPIYSAPPHPLQATPPVAESWYYCGSSGQYYPYVRHCPEGWQAVMPAR